MKPDLTSPAPAAAPPAAPTLETPSAGGVESVAPVAAIRAVRVEAGGSPLGEELAACLTEVRVRQCLSLPAQCELVFTDPPSAPAPGGPLDPGAELRVTMGGHQIPLFEGEVTAVQHVLDARRGREVRVRGYDRLHRLRKRQPVRTHVKVSPADLARELVAADGIAVECGEDGPRFDTLFQHRQSDFDLLAEVAERCGLYFTLRRGTLHLLSLGGLGPAAPTVSLVLGASLLEARAELNGDPSCRSVRALAWDPGMAEPHQGRASSPRSGRTVSAAADPARFDSPGEWLLAGEVLQEDRQAELRAQAELDRRAAHEVTLRGVAEGNPALCPGARVAAAGLGPEFSGGYVLASVAHDIDPVRGFLSEFSTAPPPASPRPRGAVMALGTVTEINDPESLGRVRVALPAYDGAESGWMGVLTAGAGKGKGLISLPDVGDQVLILCAREDLAQGVVLGGVYGAAGPPDGGIEQGVVKRYSFLTPGGQKVQLDDEKKRIRLETSEGSYVDLSPDRLRLHAAAPILIEAPGQAIVIQGKSIDFKEA